MTVSYRKRESRIWILTGFFLTVVLGCMATASADVKRVRSQTVYVPAYSHIYYGDREMPFYLTVTLSIRNTDPVNPITLLSVDYFDTDGKLIKRFQESDAKLPPIGSTRFVVKESDKSGGSGANFIVKWKAGTKVTEPIIETVMVSTATQQGISFTSRGQAIEEAVE